MKCTRLSPCGIEVVAQVPGTDLTVLPTDMMSDWIRDHRFLLLRGFQAPDDLPGFAGRLGDILEWDFGAVNELTVRPDSRNYLYTPHEVPFHWDGAFVGKIPHYIVFHCVLAPPPGAGGETLLTDAVGMLTRATPEQRQRWAAIRITYTTEKIVHYGGQFTSPMIGADGAVRYAEPVTDLNPVTLEIDGPGDGLVEEMRLALRHPDVCYAHTWAPGDVLIADNFAMLHGRRAFAHPASRHLRRVNVL